MNHTNTLLDGTIHERIRVAHLAVAEACLSTVDLGDATLVQRGSDFCCTVDDCTEVVIRFVDRDGCTDVAVDVVSGRSTGWSRLRRRRLPRAATSALRAVEHAVDAHGGSTRCSVDHVAA